MKLKHIPGSCVECWRQMNLKKHFTLLVYRFFFNFVIFVGFFIDFKNAAVSAITGQTVSLAFKFIARIILFHVHFSTILRCVSEKQL